ncbi:MAG: WXG100 family type VII secretion target [Mycobacteriaceae bacterium]|nr:WXG100 family type VII secretion target [Mycobacteriaceae bacterium]
MAGDYDFIHYNPGQIAGLIEQLNKYEGDLTTELSDAETANSHLIDPDTWSGDGTGPYNATYKAVREDLQSIIAVLKDATEEVDNAANNMSHTDKGVGGLFQHG